MVVAAVPLLTTWYQLGQGSIGQAALQLTLSYAVYLGALAASVAAYRLSPFHPLAKYPGPAILKVTKLYTVWIAWKGKNHLYTKSLHDKYGPVIRIGKRHRLSDTSVHTLIYTMTRIVFLVPSRPK